MRAVRLIQTGRNFKGWLFVLISAKNPLASNFGRHAVDEQVAFGIERLVGGVERKREALHVKLSANLAKPAVGYFCLAFKSYVLGLEPRNQRQLEFDLRIDLTVNCFWKRAGLPDALDGERF